MDHLAETRGVVSWWATDDSTPTRRQRNRVVGVLFVVGASLVWLSTVVLGGWTIVDRAAISGLFVAAALAGLVQIALSSYIPAAASLLFFAAGTACIASAQAFAGAGGVAGMGVGLLYVWVAVVVAMYLSLAAATITWLSIAAAQVIVLAAGHVEAWLPQLVLTMGTCLAGGAVAAILARRLRGLTLTDALTGVANRRGMLQTLTREVEIAAQRELPLAVAVLDLDNFKQLNDTRGHLAGDTALVSACAAWLDLLRPGDTLARFGGDEFFVALPGCDSVAAIAIAQRLAEATPVPLGCSVGVAAFAGDETGPQLLARADAALYRAKAVGGGRAILADAA